jgi:hypothetical protein
MSEESADASVTVLDFSDGGVLSAPLLRRLDAIAEAERDAFNSLVASLAVGRAREIDWWVCRPASRNTHASALHTQCMRLALVRALLDEGRRLVVKTDNPEMAKALRPLLGGQGVVLRGGWYRKRLRMAFWNACSSLFHAVASLAAARRTRRDARIPGDAPISVLETFVYRDSFQNGIFKDFHYPTFYESLERDQRRRLYYLPLFYRIRDYKALFVDLRKADRNFLLREDYLGWRDYAFAFGHWWRAAKLKGRQARFAGFEVGGLVDADLEDGRFANSIIQALLNYRFLSQPKPGLNIDRYVDWYEGHDLDHAVAAAVNWNGRKIALIDLRPIAPESYLSVTPTVHEVACGVVASIWGVIGSRVREQIARAHPSLSVLPAPGLRHLRLVGFHRLLSEASPTILVLLSQELHLVAQLLATVGPLLQTGSGYHWWFKRHPGMPREEAEVALAAWDKDAELVEGDLYDWLAKAAAVISLGSNTPIEAVAAGVPVICASSGNSPTEKPFSTDFVSGWWRMCYSPAELGAVLPSAIAAGDSASSYDVKDALLGPFGAQSMQALLFAPLPASLFNSCEGFIE